METKRRGYMFHVQLLRNNIRHFLLENNQKQIGTLIGLKPCFYLTNRFHVAVRLFSNRSQMTSKCGKNKTGTRGDSRVCH